MQWIVTTFHDPWAHVQRRLTRAALPTASALTIISAVTIQLLFSTGVRAEERPTGLPEASVATSLPPQLGDPGGLRRHLARDGVTFGANYINEYVGVASGGLNRDGHYDGRLELFLDADLAKSIGWTGLVRGGAVGDDRMPPVPGRPVVLRSQSRCRPGHRAA